MLCASYRFRSCSKKTPALFMNPPSGLGLQIVGTWSCWLRYTHTYIYIYIYIYMMQGCHTPPPPPTP